MNTEQHKITVAGLPVEIVRKNIKNLHLGVYPPTGRVRVAAPLRVIRHVADARLASRAASSACHRSSSISLASGESASFVEWTLANSRYRTESFCSSLASCLPM